jgi:hypothetical protein
VQAELTMHYELWGLSAGNRIAAPQTEVEALVLVRELIEDGWDPEDLALALEPDEESECAVQHPVIGGAELKARAYEYA